MPLQLKNAFRDKLPGAQVDCEGDFLVGVHVPGLAVEGVVFDGGEGDAFVGELFGLPGLAVHSPGEEGVVADEE